MQKLKAKINIFKKTVLALFVIPASPERSRGAQAGIQKQELCKQVKLEQSTEFVRNICIRYIEIVLHQVNQQNSVILDSCFRPLSLKLQRARRNDKIDRGNDRKSKSDKKSLVLCLIVSFCTLSFAFCVCK